MALDGGSTPLKRTGLLYATIALFVLLGVAPLIVNPASIQYITSHNALPLLPWGACCGFKGPASDLLGLDAVVFLLYVEVFVASPLSLLTALLLWARRKRGATLGTYLAIGRLGITLIAFAAPYGVIFFVQLLLVRQLRNILR